MAPGDVVRRMMEETGLSVLDLLATTVEIARRDYPMELVRCRDQIVESLYRGVQCLECGTMGMKHLSDLHCFIAETKTRTRLSDSPQVVVKEISSQMPEKRSPLRVVIPLRKKESPILEVTERSKSESHDTEAKESVTDSNEMNQFQKNKLKKEDFTEYNIEKAKRKLRESYEMATTTKKQRCVKVLSINELPKQGICRPKHKDVKRTASRAAPIIQSKRRNLVELSTNEKITSKYRSAGGLFAWGE